MGTKYKGNASEVQSLDTYIKFIRASETISSRINSSLAKNGLSESQFYVLDALFHLGPLSQKDLGKKIFCSNGNITMVVDNLEKEGFVTRKRSEDDRRVFFVHITKKGAKKIQHVLPVLVKKISVELSILNENEHEELQRLTKKIGLSDKSGN